MDFGNILQGFGSVLGPILGFIGQEEANDTNVMLNRENRYFQAELANTQYQRSVSDMRAAGLNPALMFKNAAPSAVPSTSPATVQSELGAAVTSAQQVGTLIAGLEKIAAETGLIEAQKKNVEAQTITEIAKPESVKAMTALYGANTAKAVAEQVLTEAQTKTEAVRPTEVLGRANEAFASSARAYEEANRIRGQADLDRLHGRGRLGQEFGSGEMIGRRIPSELRDAVRDQLDPVTRVRRLLGH